VLRPLTWLPPTSSEKWDGQVRRSQQSHQFMAPPTAARSVPTP
jgi:hypothetical protein